MRKHGCAKSAEHLAWLRAIRRCSDSRDRGFAFYGAKGISVADAWLGERGFETFLRDVGRKPSADLALRRIDRSGNFEPGNVTWGPKGRATVIVAKEARHRATAPP
jgi:hypothetical protein